MKLIFGISKKYIWKYSLIKNYSFTQGVLERTLELKKNGKSKKLSYNIPLFYDNDFESKAKKIIPINIEPFLHYDNPFN